MISVCCCAINSKFDVEIFIRALNHHNKDCEFEIVIAHDDRVNDGTGERLEELKKEFKNLVVVRHTHEDTVEYLERLIRYYEEKQIFTREIRAGLAGNLEKFKRGELFEQGKNFLWLTSGLLYDKAIQASKGDLLIVTPADFLYLFRLSDLRKIANDRQRGGIFYAKPHAIWARLSNQDPTWLKSYVDELHRGIGVREGYRWDSEELFRDYLRNPQTLDNLALCDVQGNKIIPLSEFGDFNSVYKFNEAAFRGGIQTVPSFHGFHAMTRKTYDKIGGFTQEMYGRAFADDKMTELGKQNNFSPLPLQISVAWCEQSRLRESGILPYEQNWKETLAKVDPFFDKHPMPNQIRATYLHDGIMDDVDMYKVVCQNFSTKTPPVRLI